MQGKANVKKKEVFGNKVFPKLASSRGACGIRGEGYGQDITFYTNV